MSSLVTELCFADDAVVTASTREDIAKATVELQQVTAECGLTISFLKTKLMVAEQGSWSLMWYPYVLVVVLLIRYRLLGI